jgi:hypothetical protein
VSRQIKRLCGLALLLLITADLADCGAIQPCNQSPYLDNGPCSVGRHQDTRS